jgi:hypothetical protein
MGKLGQIGKAGILRQQVKNDHRVSLFRPAIAQDITATRQTVTDADVIWPDPAYCSNMMAAPRPTVNRFKSVSSVKRP